MYAIVKQGGKQYRVAAGEDLVCDRVKGEIGGPFVFEKHLLVSDGGNTAVSDEDIAKYSIKAELVEHFNDEKVLVFKYKAKKGYRRTRGHRQAKSRVRVLAIEPEKKAVKASATSKAKTETVTDPKTDTKKEKPAEQE